MDLTPLVERRRKEIATLSRRRGRDRLGQFLVEGVRSVAAAADAGAPLVDVVVAESVKDTPDVLRLLGRLRVPAWRAPDRIVERLGDVQASQGIVAVAASGSRTQPDPVVAGRLLLLDGVQDPGNVGTLLRTAAWFGIDHVVAGSGTADFHGPKVVRASMGAIWDIALSESSDLASLVARLREAGFEVWGADMRGTRLADWKPAARAALVLGSEAAGLSAAVREACTGTVTIPATGRVRGTESLNVAAAAAILVARLSGAG